MEFTYKQIKQMSCEQLYNIFFSDFNKLYDKYNFIDFTKEEYEEFIKNNIQLIVNKLKKADVIDSNYFIKKLDLILNNYVVQKVNENDCSQVIIKNYIDQNIKMSKDYEDALKQFNKFLKFFNVIKVDYSIELCEKIISENKIINNILNLIVEKNIELIKKGTLELAFEDSIAQIFIESFCMLNDIKQELDLEKLYKNLDLNYYDIEYTDDDEKSYLREIKKYPLLTKEEEKELAIRIKQGDEQAKKMFIERNLKLVVSQAKRYKYFGLPFLDLVQEGNLGLIHAVDKFDVTKGYRFSTYAFFWIRQAFMKYIYNSSRTIKIPEKIYMQIKKYNDMQIKLMNEFYREPTIEELADALNVTIEDVLELQKNQEDVISLNSVFGEENEELENFIPSSEVSPDILAINNYINLELNKIIENSNLTEKEKNIFRLRYPLNGENKYTVKQIAEMYNISEQSIRSIETKALLKLRRLDSIRKLKDQYLYGYIDRSNTKIYKKNIS